MLLVPRSPWAGRVWALPFLTALAPLGRWTAVERKLRHKKLTDWGQASWSCQARRWMPGRRLVVVDRRGLLRPYVLGFPCCGRRISLAFFTRLRLDAASLPTGPAAPDPGTIGRPPGPKGRAPADSGRGAWPNRKPQGWQRVTVPGWYGEGATAHRGDPAQTPPFGATNSGLPVVPIRWVLLRDPSPAASTRRPCSVLIRHRSRCRSSAWFVQRWQLEVTFREVRDHLGVETQRQWSDKAIARTTPCLLGLFSVVTSPCWRHASTAVPGSRSGPAPGTTSSGQPLPTVSPQYDGQSGVSRVSPCPGSPSTLQNFRQPSARASPMPSTTPLEWPKSRLVSGDARGADQFAPALVLCRDACREFFRGRADGLSP